MSDVSAHRQQEVTAHLNQSHRHDLLQIAQAFADAAWATDATIQHFDFAGLELQVQGGSRQEACRVEFATPAETEAGIERCFMVLLDTARQQLGVVVGATSLSAQASRRLPFASQQVFGALCAVWNYPEWLPPIGRIVASSHVLLVEGSRFSAAPRGQADAVMQIDVLDYRQDAALHWREAGGHLHALCFTLKSDADQPDAAQTQLSVHISHSSSGAEHSREQAQHRLGKLAEVIAHKLETYLVETQDRKS